MLVNILKEAINKKASDVILSTDMKPSLKLFGEIIFLDDFGLLTKDILREMTSSIMSNYQQEIFLKNKELDFSISLGETRFRVNAFMEKKGYAMVFRIIPSIVPNFDDLGLPQVIKDFTNKRNGLVLVTGSVGSGKSTTMASLINEINKTSSKHIITVEDPIEFVFKSEKSLIEQREVGTTTLSFDNGLKYILRQAPDVIMIGEMRDLDTFRLALRAAETGNLVFATLHTSGVARTISRIIDMFPVGEKEQIRAQLAESLIGIIWQKLLKKSSGKGREVASEVLINTIAIANVIRKGEIHKINGILETSSNQGMIQMKSSLEDLFGKGEISKEVYDLELRNLVNE